MNPTTLSLPLINVYWYLSGCCWRRAAAEFERYAALPLEYGLMNKKALLFLLWLFLTIAFAVGTAAIFDVKTYYLLSKRGMLTEGYVTDTDREHHRTVHYSYTVNQQPYKWGGYAGDINRQFEEIKVGDKVPVVYDPLNPGSSCLGDPNDVLRSLMHGVIFVSLFPTFFLISYLVQKRRGKIGKRRESAA